MSVFSTFKKGARRRVDQGGKAHQLARLSCPLRQTSRRIGEIGSDGSSVIGLRLADLQRLRRSQIVITNGDRVRVRISKGHRTASKAKTLRIENFSSIFHFPVPACLQVLLTGPCDERPFEDVTIGAVYAALKEASRTTCNFLQHAKGIHHEYDDNTRSFQLERWSLYARRRGFIVSVL